jgi:hypothetical protein
MGLYDPHTRKMHNRSGKVISNSGDVQASLIPKEKN